MIQNGLSKENYKDWFDILLWCEEMKLDSEMTIYSIENVKLSSATKDSTFCEVVKLHVPGLSQNRPALIVNDRVFVTIVGGSKKVYEGFVHVKRENYVHLAFGRKFMENFIDGIKVNVRFTYSRYTHIRFHQALEHFSNQNITRILFPVPNESLALNVKTLNYFNSKITDNENQSLAVENIVAGTSHPAPYIIFGPPGTGKTSTVVEAILQICHQSSKKYVLACAQSNSACDLIAEKLLKHMKETSLLRMNSYSRNKHSMSSKLKKVSNLDCNDEVVYPRIEEAKKYKVIVTTLVTAARLLSRDEESSYFTHIFIDECAQSMEPETLIALGGFTSKSTKVILIGDHFQLGPVIRNSLCWNNGVLFRNGGLDRSLMERLMNFDMYKNLDNSHYVVKLTKTYRSHKDIIKVPNDSFYNNEMECSGNKGVTHSLEKWTHLPKPGFPLIFHSVSGKEEREGKSPSYFNSQEVSVVIGYIEKLLQNKLPIIKPKDIGVITPYKSQVEKLRNQLQRKFDKMSEFIKVGTVEDFQGDERLVIIVSTVRANPDFLINDKAYKLGFLTNPKRFNVAVTRAKALLIVAGHPVVLSFDPHWSKLITFIKANGGFVGPDLERNAILMQVLESFKKLDLNTQLPNVEVKTDPQ